MLHPGLPSNVFHFLSEDIYAGVEFKAGTPAAKQLMDWLHKKQMGHRIRWSDECALGIKPVSKEGVFTAMI